MNDISTLEATAETDLDQIPLLTDLPTPTNKPAWIALPDSQLADAIITIESKIEEWESQLAPHYKTLNSMKEHLLGRMRERNAKVLAHDEFEIERKVTRERDIHAADLLEALTRYNLDAQDNGRPTISLDDLTAAIRWHTPDPVLKTDGTKLNALVRDYGDDVKDIVETHCPYVVKSEKLSIMPKSPKKVRKLTGDAA